MPSLALTYLWVQMACHLQMLEGASCPVLYPSCYGGDCVVTSCRNQLVTLCTWNVAPTATTNPERTPPNNDFNTINGIDDGIIECTGDSTVLQSVTWCAASGCIQCQGGCSSDDECDQGLKCFARSSTSDPVPGCDPGGAGSYENSYCVTTTTTTSTTTTSTTTTKTSTTTTSTTTSTTTTTTTTTTTEAQVIYTGTLTCTGTGLTPTQVEIASKEALASVVEVGVDAIIVVVTESDGTFDVDFTVAVNESSASAVQTKVTEITSNSSTLGDEMKKELITLGVPESSAAITIAKFFAEILTTTTTPPTATSTTQAIQPVAASSSETENLPLGLILGISIPLVLLLVVSAIVVKMKWKTMCGSSDNSRSSKGKEGYNAFRVASSDTRDPEAPQGSGSPYTSEPSSTTSTSRTSTASPSGSPLSPPTSSNALGVLSSSPQGGKMLRSATVGNDGVQLSATETSIYKAKKHKRESDETENKSKDKKSKSRTPRQNTEGKSSGTRQTTEGKPAMTTSKSLPAIPESFGRASGVTGAQKRRPHDTQTTHADHRHIRLSPKQGN